MTELLGWAINCAVPVVATIASVDSLHPNLVPGRGRKKGFTTVVNLKLPNAVSCPFNPGNPAQLKFLLT